MEILAGHIAAAVTMRGLYPQNHPRVNESIAQVLATLQQLTSEAKTDSVTFLVVGDDLVIGDEVIRKTTPSVREFTGIMHRCGVERLTLAMGLDQEEAHRFIEALMNGDHIETAGHIIAGRAQLVMEDQDKKQEPRRELSTGQLEIVRDAWARFRVERRLPVDQLEVLVWSFIDSLSGTTRTMLPLARLREHDEYTFVHSINVSLLVLAQARSFGIWGPMLHSFGMAGLLHDIGKLTVPVEVLEKAGALASVEWELMKNHAREGAWYLAEIEGTPALAVIVAYEHHLRYDKRPNYPLLREARLPSLASRMTAIADTFDAVSCARPHQEPMTRATAFEVLRKRAGSYYDPQLVANFIRLLSD